MEIIISRHNIGWHREDDGKKTYTLTIYSKEGAQELKMSEDEFEQLKTIIENSDY